MAESSTIEWTDATWQPITGCAIVSPGCTNCYAMKLAGTRLRNLPSRKGLTVQTKAGPVWNGKVRLNEEWLTQPLTWRRPRKIFVCAHGDLFAEGVPDEWIDRVFAVMALCPQHTFQVLTKRPARMREWFEERWQPTPAQRIECPGLPAFDMPAQAEGDDRHERVYQAAGEFLDLDTVSDRFWNPDGSRKWPGWPLPNVWLGISTEDQRRADERVPDLLATPAAVRFVSAEPLLGPITNWTFKTPTWPDCDQINALTGGGRSSFSAWGGGARKLDWIIVGGESGPGARPMHPDWARQIRDACASADVAYLFKQWGAWAPRHDLAADTATLRGLPWHNFDPDTSICRIGKKAAGRLLDGVEHNGFPEVRS
ncbi:phage Gp37/Gp68 family protein [Methylobacterium brachiatum]|uniref:phage Gp37/Gp68 family protein n=1 Tax=Methylobacterium brachiatum TaxID=269660 RepID=UPI000EFC7AC2|nr:phage Gp37/Gp68 family protein [Methylobacterium brachiatum]AYO85377.1 phage Gp37/Gp68 family protein [Methylobacterium brachiatum]